MLFYFDTHCYIDGVRGFYILGLYGMPYFITSSSCAQAMMLFPESPTKGRLFVNAARFYQGQLQKLIAVQAPKIEDNLY